MKKALFSLLTIAAIGLAAFSPVSELPIGASIPNAGTKMKDISGKLLSLAEAKGKNGLLVMFSCNTCPFVVRNEGTTKKVMEYAAAHKVGMIIINSNEAQRTSEDSYTAMKQYAKAQGYTVPYVIDEQSKLADMFGASHTPEVYLFNSRNKLVYKGAMSDNAADPKTAKVMYAENAIDAVASGKEVATKTTKSIGCSIKRKA